MTAYLSCPDHCPVQHRDGKPPWCDRCGLTADYQVPESKFDKENNRVTIQIKTTQTLQCALNDLTADVLSNFLHPIAGDTKVRVRVSQSDRPGEMSMVYFEAETTESQVSHSR